MNHKYETQHVFQALRVFNEFDLFIVDFGTRIYLKSTVIACFQSGSVKVENWY